jgi:hypothetical protein
MIPGNGHASLLKKISKGTVPSRKDIRCIPLCSSLHHEGASV